MASKAYRFFAKTSTISLQLHFLASRGAESKKEAGWSAQALIYRTQTLISDFQAKRAMERSPLD